MEGRRRAYILLGVIGVLEVVALVVLFAVPSHKTKAPGATVTGHASKIMELTSSAFSPNGSIPSVYTCEGGNINPPLVISHVPAGARSLALLVDDPDVPQALMPGGVFDHWVLYNMPTTTKEIPPNSHVGTIGKNGMGKEAYTGPCPPSQYEPKEHRYVFKLYALDQELLFAGSPTKTEVVEAMKGHILETAELVGMYQKMHQKNISK